MSRRKTFDPDDQIVTLDVQMGKPQGAFATTTVYALVDAARKPHEGKRSKQRRVSIRIDLGKITPDAVAEALWQIGKEIRAATRKKPKHRPTKLNILGFIKRAKKVLDAQNVPPANRFVMFDVDTVLRHFGWTAARIAKYRAAHPELHANVDPNVVVFKTDQYGRGMS